jgi:hypothetical protein
LKRPAIPEGIEGRCSGAPEKSRSLDDSDQPEHFIRTEKAEEIVNASNVDVIENQKGSCI